MCWFPGAVGLWLRQKFFPARFQSCGKGVLFGRFVDFASPENIVLGDRVVLNNGVKLDAGSWKESSPAIVLEDDVFIGTGTEIKCGASGAITIQAGANFSSFCRVRATCPMTVGKNILVAAYCRLGEVPEQEGSLRQQVPENPEEEKKTVIGNGCWLGVRMSMAEGVNVGNDTIVGAHAVVETDLPSYAIAVGQPAKRLKDRRVE